MNLTPNPTPLTAWSAPTSAEAVRLDSWPVIGWTPHPSERDTHLPVCVIGGVAVPVHEVAVILPTDTYPTADDLSALAGAVRRAALRALQEDRSTAAMLAAGAGTHPLAEAALDGLKSVEALVEFLDDFEAEADFGLAGIELTVDVQAGTYTLQQRQREPDGETPATRRARALLERTLGGPS